MHDLLLVELFDVEYYRDLELWVRGHARSLKVVPFESMGTVSYSPSIVNMAVSLAVSDISSLRKMAWLWNLYLGSFKVIENGAVRQTMYDFLLVRHCDYSCILYRLRVIWRWIISWPWNRGQRSLKVIEIGAIGKLGCRFYSTSIVTMAASVTVCEILSVKKWCDIENRIRVRSRSLEMTPFDRSHP